jgi:hypothetical protein
MVIQTIAIPRGQAVMVIGQAGPDSTEFELHATAGAATNGICSNPFLEQAFTTVEVRVRVRINPDGTWLYDEDTVMKVLGRDEPFHHTDRHTLKKVSEPTPNPMAPAGPYASAH